MFTFFSLVRLLPVLESRFQSKGVGGHERTVYHLQKVSLKSQSTLEDMDLEQRKTKNNTVQITSKSCFSLYRTGDRGKGVGGQCTLFFQTDILLKQRSAQRQRVSYRTRKKLNWR